MRVEARRIAPDRPADVPGLGPRGRAAGRTRPRRHPGRSARVARGAGAGVGVAVGEAEARAARADAAASTRRRSRNSSSSCARSCGCGSTSGSGRPNLPELTVCRPVEARNVKGAFPFGALAGPGVLHRAGTRLRSGGAQPARAGRRRARAVGGHDAGAGRQEDGAHAAGARRHAGRGGRQPRGRSRNGPRPNGRRRSTRSRPRCRSSSCDGPDGTTPVPSGSGPNGTKSVPPVPGTAGTENVPTSHPLQPFPL